MIFFLVVFLLVSSLGGVNGLWMKIERQTKSSDYDPSCAVDTKTDTDDDINFHIELLECLFRFVTNNFIHTHRRTRQNTQVK